MTIEDIRKLVEDNCGFDISVKSRKIEIIKYRYIYYYLCKKYLHKYSNDEIAGLVGFDRNTLRNGIKSLDGIINYDKDKQAILVLNIVEDAVKAVCVLPDELNNAFVNFEKLNISLRLKKVNEKTRFLQNKIYRKNVRIKELENKIKELHL